MVEGKQPRGKLRPAPTQVRRPRCPAINLILRTARRPPTLPFCPPPQLASCCPWPGVRAAQRSAQVKVLAAALKAAQRWVGGRNGAERAGASRPLHGASPAPGLRSGARPALGCPASASRRPCAGDAPWWLPQGAGAQPPTRGWPTAAARGRPRLLTPRPRGPLRPAAAPGPSKGGSRVRGAPAEAFASHSAAPPLRLRITTEFARADAGRGAPRGGPGRILAPPCSVPASVGRRTEHRRASRCLR